MIILFNKPFNVLCQFTGGTANLSNYISLKGVYAAGRLDKDSEGLLLLTDDGALQHQVTITNRNTLKRWSNKACQSQNYP